MKKRKKRSITLIEVMIVILLIGLIGGALAFNMRGSLDEGKAFKTEQNIARVHDILMLEYAKGDLTLQQVKENAAAIIKKSPLTKGDGILKDGWNKPLNIVVDETNDQLTITSDKLNGYRTQAQ